MKGGQLVGPGLVVVDGQRFLVDRRGLEPHERLGRVGGELQRVIELMVHGVGHGADARVDLNMHCARVSFVVDLVVVGQRKAHRRAKAHQIDVQPVLTTSRGAVRERGGPAHLDDLALPGVLDQAEHLAGQGRVAWAEPMDTQGKQRRVDEGVRRIGPLAHREKSLRQCPGPLGVQPRHRRTGPSRGGWGQQAR